MLVIRPTGTSGADTVRLVLTSHNSRGLGMLQIDLVPAGWDCTPRPARRLTCTGDGAAVDGERLLVVAVPARGASVTARLSILSGEQDPDPSNNVRHWSAGDPS